MIVKKFILYLLALVIYGTGVDSRVFAGDHPPVSPGISDSLYTSAVSPIIDPDGADPFVLKTEGGYLYTKTTGSDICLGMTDSILKLGACSEKVVFRPDGGLKDLWAPEIWSLDGRWYIYFAAVVPGEEMHHMYVLENSSEDPMQGEWTCLPLAGMDDKFAIDGTVFELNEKRYFLWSGWEGDTNIRQDLYLAEMVSPIQVKEEKICLSVPEYPWETVGNPLVNEGPEILIKGNTVNLVYSASGSWTDDYCLGLLTMHADDDPKIPGNWIKHEMPILEKSGDVYGPGHNCFTVSPDGTQDLIVYHAARWKGAGWTRNVRFGYVAFEDSGSIARMQPVSGEDRLPVPSGSGRICSVPLKDAVLSDDLTYICADSQSSGSQMDAVIKGRWSGKTEILLPLSAENNMEAVLTLYVQTFKTREGSLCTLGAATDSGTTAASVYAAENPQPVSLLVELHPGDNSVRIFTIEGRAELEILRMELMQ